ncbi:MAG: thiol reductant ABC exporter subunit CydD [Propionibacteriaceae bacterium]|jgi:ATP-binding cassette subfamily C protein CydCD|nr:thiol reductant ABC exporter subunit CydD [Propionibacteriaceae bacterium]
MVAGVAVGLCTAALTLIQAKLLSEAVTDVFNFRPIDGSAGTLPLLTAIVVIALIFAAKAALAWASEWLGHRSSAKVKQQLRADIATKAAHTPIPPPPPQAVILEPQARGSSSEERSTPTNQERASAASTFSPASLVTLITQGLDALDAYFAKYLPQLGLAATVPIIVVAFAFFSDVTSALIMLVTIPLIPVFMMLVGWTTRRRTEKRWRIQLRLANHFSDLIAGLPTLQAFGRAQAQLKGLEKSEEAHRKETLATLRISFLSALTLELLATLSVAVIAVTIGFRVLYGDMDLASALFILVIAPEAYAPVRAVGTHFHDSVNGSTAAETAFAYLDAETGAVPAPEATPAPATAAPLAVVGLSHTYPGADAPALPPTSFAIAKGQLVALIGPSGCGKTTLLNAVLGFLTPSSGAICSAGQPVTDWDAWRAKLAYVGQAPRLVCGTVADNVRLGFPDATDRAVREALDAAGAPEIELDHLIGSNGAGVSAGETRRIAIARAVLRVTLGRATLLIMDEPTAGLDADSEAATLASLRALGVSALVVTHRPAVIAAADTVIDLTHTSPSLRSDAPTPSSSDEARESMASSNHPKPVILDRRSGIQSDHAEGIWEDTERASEASTTPLLSRLFTAVPHSRKRLAFAILLACCATFASVALMGFSAWLLSRAAELPLVRALLVAAVMVRFFGISRGVFRYLERIYSHDVALRLQSALRLKLYQALSRTTLLGRDRGDLLNRAVTDAEAIANLIVRVWIPFISASLVILVSSGLICIWSLPSGLTLLLTALAAGLLVPILTSRASKQADAQSVELRGELAADLNELMYAAPDLLAYGVQAEYLAKFTEVDDTLERHEARSAWVRGISGAMQVLASGVAVLGALWFGSEAVLAGNLDRTMLAVLVLVPLALHESLTVLTSAAQTFTSTRAALARVQELIDAPPVGSGDKPDTHTQAAPALTLRDLAVGWPPTAADSAPTPLVEHLSLQVHPGETVALTGRSGVGKTTIATTLLGMIPPLAGSYEVDGSLGYLSQDAHIFGTTVAENIRIGKRDATDAEIQAALVEAGLPDLDPALVVGDTGQPLSGGESRRLALARLLVGDYQVWILDEPTEHLDSLTSAAILDDIWHRTAHHPALIITHDPAVISRCTSAVDL